MKTILDLHNIYYSYHTSHGETRALSNLSFSLAPGEFAAVVGPSGCGKSTLLSLICGLMKPQTGEILLNGESVHGNSPQIGYMLQHDHLFEWRTIYRNILLGPEISHTLNKEIREKAKSMLTQYGLKSFIHAMLRGVTLAAHAPDRFGALLVVGFVVQVALQAVLNIAVVTNTIPNTGISLPFFSSGGTSLMMLLGEMGIVLSVSRGET